MHVVKNSKCPELVNPLMLWTVIDVALSVTSVHEHGTDDFLAVLSVGSFEEALFNVVIVPFMTERQDYLIECRKCPLMCA